jgi:hypothetical protein
MRRLILAAAFAALAIPTSALADPPPWAPAHGRRAKEAYRYDQYERRDHYERYDDRGRYEGPRPIGYDDHIWKGRDGRYYCRRSNGTTGLIVGGALGALVGRELDGGRDRTVGTVVGAAGGALLGREIDRGRLKCQ